MIDAPSQESLHLMEPLEINISKNNFLFFKNENSSTSKKKSEICNINIMKVKFSIKGIMTQRSNKITVQFKNTFYLSKVCKTQFFIT